MEITRRSAAALQRMSESEASFAARAAPSTTPTLRKGAQALLANRERQLAAARSGAVRAATPPDRRSDVQRNMDRFLNDCRAPYRVRDQEVRVAPAFRMNGGYGPQDGTAVKLAKKLPPELRRELGSRIAAVTGGKGNPEEIRRVTQALIDRGELSRFPAPTLEQSIRKLQFAHGIGMDCSGFSYQSSLFAAGRGRNVGLNEGVPFPKRSESALDARPGDLIVLEGHKVAVYSHEKLAAGAAAPRFPGRPAVDPSFMQGGPVHVFEVDSSWGGGPLGDKGGVARNVWLFNESSREWAYFDQYSGGGFTVSKNPYDHRLSHVAGPRP